MGKVLSIINPQGNQNQNQNKVPPHTFWSISKSCSALCNSMDCSIPGFPVLHYPPEFTQIPVLSWWCHSTNSSSIAASSSCPQFPPVSGSFAMTQLFASGGQSTGASALASVLPMNIQCGFTWGLIWSPSVHGTLKSLLQHQNLKVLIISFSAFFRAQISYSYKTTGKSIALTLCQQSDVSTF